MNYVVFFLLLVAALLAGCAAQEPGQVLPSTTVDGAAGTVPAGSLQFQCENMGGTWITGAEECEGIDVVACQELGGTYNECASACRNNPDAQVCTMQCVFVCELGNKDEAVSTVETFLVGPETMACVGVGPMTCLVVNGELFYDTIAGFDHKEGTSYELLVQKTLQENVPADASVYTYTLLEVVSEMHECTQDEKETMACTRDYRPVCGNDGQTYANGCTACSSGLVESWTAGLCE